MTFAEAREQLRRAREAAPAAMRAGLDAVAREAVVQLGELSPRDTGEFAESWFWEPPTLGNAAPYAAFVHDGEFADRVVPQVLEDLDPTFATTVEAAIDAAAGWK